MTFHVRMARVDRPRRPWPLVGLAFGAVVVVVAALAGGPSDAGRGQSPAAHGAPSGQAARASDAGLAIADAAVARPPRRLPATLACEDLTLAECARLARAALAVLPDDVAEVSAGTVWRSLRCGDTPDCPPEYLDDAKPLGSVVFVFADGSPRAAINVVEWRHGPAIRLGPRAWIVEWLPDPG